MRRLLAFVPIVEAGDEGIDVARVHGRIQPLNDKPAVTRRVRPHGGESTCRPSAQPQPAPRRAPPSRPGTAAPLGRVYFRSRDRDFDPAGTELPAVVQGVRRMGDSSCSHSLGGAGRSRSRRRERPSQGQSGPQCDSDAACPRARRDRHHERRPGPAGRDRHRSQSQDLGGCRGRKRRGRGAVASAGWAWVRGRGQRRQRELLPVRVPWSDAGPVGAGLRR